MASFHSPGIVTFLFTDIEDSIRLWEQERERMSVALASHDALVRAAVDGNHGVVVKVAGDGFHAAFDDPVDTVNATLAIQIALGDADAQAPNTYINSCIRSCGRTFRRSARWKRLRATCHVR